MRNLKRLATSLVALALLLAFSSCEKQATGDALQEVSFNINNVTDALIKKTVGPNDNNIPTCKDLPAAYAIVTLSGGDIVGSQDYKLNILSGLNNGTETQVIKLAVGDYMVDGFLVYAADDGDPATDELLWAAPEACSYYAELWGISGVTPTTSCIQYDANGDEIPSLGFTVVAFTKAGIDVDVLCWEEYSYDDFGFNWFKFHEITVKTICFFGDVCTPYYRTWSQTQMDFVAEIQVDIYKDGGLVGTGNNTGDLNNPLCVEYPEFGDLENETYKVTITLLNAPVSVNPSYDLYLNADTGLFNGIGDLDINEQVDTDGIFDFVLSEGEDCNYTGNVGVNAILVFDGQGNIIDYKP